MHVIMSAVGSGGDVFPYLGIGRELTRRGHRATLLTSAYHEPAARAAGIAFAASRRCRERNGPAKACDLVEHAHGRLPSRQCAI